MTVENVRKVIADIGGRPVIVELNNGEKIYADNLGIREVGYGSYLEFINCLEPDNDVLTCGSVKSIVVADTITPIPEVEVKFGSDPEFFFVDKNNDVVPSGVVLEADTEHVIRDGFQGELNPESSSCRQSAATFISNALIEAREHADAAGLDISFDCGHIIGDEAWHSTPKSSRRFGCNPTLNAQEKRKLSINGMGQRFRSAGGHVHIGLPNRNHYNNARIERVVRIMDIIAGNLAVLIDRDPNNARRRKYYGRAGEYREKKYGLEYRVFSNFWLKHYVLWSFVAGQLRNAVSIEAHPISEKLLAEFQPSRIKMAINNNDQQLALLNANKLMEFYEKHGIIHSNGVDSRNFHNFMRWAISDNPLRGLLKNTDSKTILRHWETLESPWDDGFEMFIDHYKY